VPEAYDAVTTTYKEQAMKLCPVAVAVGCAKCPVFKVCPAKGIIGDFKEAAADAAKEAARKAKPAKGK
jgi:hypothetical protein